MVQDFDENGKPLAQRFLAGDHVEHFDRTGEETYITICKKLEYMPFHMEQPNE